jgi:hypothetical protein
LGGLIFCVLVSTKPLVTTVPATRRPYNRCRLFLLSAAGKTDRTVLKGTALMERRAGYNE